MKRTQEDLLEMAISGIEVGQQQPEGYQPVRLKTSRGNVDCRYYPVAGTQRGVIWVGGVGGGWDTPAQGLYPRLCQEFICQEFMDEAIASLRVRFRHPTQMEESILDVLAGINYLQSEGVKLIALTGHSFGGAVVIQAAAISQAVRTVVTLATQSYGADAVSQLASPCSILLLHGTADQVLTPACSKYVYELAHEPKRLILYQGADHGLDQVATEVHQVAHDWIVEQLN